MVHFLVMLTFLAGAVPAVLLWVFYGFLTRWEATRAGRVLFSLITVTMASYVLSTLVTLHPAWFNSGNGAVLRIGARVAIDVVLWMLLALFVRAQFDRKDPPNDQAP